METEDKFALWEHYNADVTQPLNLYFLLSLFSFAAWLGQTTAMPVSLPEVSV